MKIFKVLLILALITVNTSCKNDDISTTPPQGNDPDPTTFSQNFGNEISRNFLGTVVDKNNNPIENVTITVGSSIASTDSNGVFIINNANVNERFAYIKASKAGYIHGSRAVVPSSGTNKITIMLLDETVIGTTNSGSQETFNLDNGASVSLEGEYIKEDGTAYSGSVDVIMHHLDPEDENMSNQMPGMLYAANSQNEERMLQTYGMLAVELRGSGGEDINLAEGSTAEIRVPLAANLVASAPATIPLWHFDETHGYWIEDGQANLVGNEYVGTVSHFSFWSCGASFETVHLCINIVNQNEIPISNIFATLSTSNFESRSGLTNENGEICGLIPKNEELNLTLNTYMICGESDLFSTTIGPFTNNNTITITLETFEEWVEETIIGNFNNCDENPINNGYIKLNYGNHQYIDFINNGSFELHLLRCGLSSNFIINAIDYTNLQSTTNIEYTFTTPLTNIGAIIACNDLQEFIQYKIDDQEPVTIFESIYASFNEYNTSLNAPTLTINSNDCFYLLGILNSPEFTNSYNNLNSTNNIGITINPQSIGNDICFNMSNENNNIIYNLTTLGDVGEYININFSGDYLDFQGNTHTITGVIHVLRDE